MKGRKRQVLVDTQGTVLKVHVHAADESDNAGGQALLTKLADQFPRVCHLWTDSGYKTGFAQWVEQTLGWTVECVRHPIAPRGDYAQVVKEFLGEQAYAARYGPGFKLLPRRWVVERTFAWLDRQRRLSKDYELLPATSEAWIYLTSARLLWRRLAQSNT